MKLTSRLHICLYEYFQNCRERLLQQLSRELSLLNVEERQQLLQQAMTHETSSSLDTLVDDNSSRAISKRLALMDHPATLDPMNAVYKSRRRSYTHTHARTLYTFIYTYTHVSAHTQTRKKTHTQTNTHTHIYTRTHTHSLTHMLSSQSFSTLTGCAVLL